jgi:hypothetical protein
MVKSIDESKKIASIHLNRLVDEAGSQAHLARMLSTEGGYAISPQGVLRWFKRGQISKHGAIATVNHPDFSDKFTLCQLRPDVPADDWDNLEEDNN